MNVACRESTIAVKSDSVQRRQAQLFAQLLELGRAGLFRSRGAVRSENEVCLT